VGHGFEIPFSPGFSGIVERGVLHGVAQGGLSVAQGGKFGPAFLSASFSAIASHSIGVGGTKKTAGPSFAQHLGRGATAAIVGGTASVIGGGKFANGAVTAAFVYAFNARGGARSGGRGQSLSPGRAAREAANPNLRGGLDYGPSRRGELAPLPRDRSLVLHEYPPSSGFLPGSQLTVLSRGTIVDRHGSPLGSFLAPAGTPFHLRGLPASAARLPLQSYEVIQPFPVQSGTTAPAFGGSGGGTQFYTGVPVRELINRGYLAPR